MENEKPREARGRGRARQGVDRQMPRENKDRLHGEESTNNGEEERGQKRERRRGRRDHLATHKDKVAQESSEVLPHPVVSSQRDGSRPHAQGVVRGSEGAHQGMRGGEHRGGGRSAAPLVEVPKKSHTAEEEAALGTIYIMFYYLFYYLCTCRMYVCRHQSSEVSEYARD